MDTKERKQRIALLKARIASSEKELATKARRKYPGDQVERMKKELKELEAEDAKERKAEAGKAEGKSSGKEKKAAPK